MVNNAGVGVGRPIAECDEAMWDAHCDVNLWDSVSPFMEVENITTPTLFIGGEKDWNQPIIHSEQMCQAMTQLGREASLVVYPDAHHGIRRPVYQRDLLRRFVDWFDKYVKNPRSDK